MYRTIGFALALSLTTIVAAQQPPTAPAAPPAQPAQPSTQQPAAQPPASQPPAGQQPPTPTFKGGIDVVSLNVTVTDGGSKSFVTDLDRGEFAVFGQIDSLTHDEVEVLSLIHISEPTRPY